MKVLLFFWCIIESSFASHELGSSYGAGQSFALDKVRGVQEASKRVDKAQLPEFKEGKSPESLQEFQLGDEALRETARNPASAFIKDTAGKRKTYVIDPKMDPLFVAGNKATTDPLKTINQEVTVVTQEEKQRDTYETCDEGKDEVKRSCSKTLDVDFNVIPEVKRIEYFCPGHKKQSWLSGTRWCKPATCNSREVIDRPKQEIPIDIWSDGCQVLEKAVDEGTCSYESTYNGPGGTRNIKERPVTRDHFEEYYTYRCFKPTDDKCERLREKGCIQVDSECKEKENGQCLVWRQTYRCRPNSISWQFFKSKGPIFCLGGDCNRVSYGPNADFLV